MTQSHRARRTAVIGLAVTMLALIGLSVVGAASTRRSAETVSRSAALAQAYDRAHDAVAAEESLERKYRLEPGSDVRGQHAAAGDDLNQALDGIRAGGEPADRLLADRLRILHERYLASVTVMFAAIDAGDDATVERIDSRQTDPVFTQMSDVVKSATDEHARAAAHALGNLHLVEGMV